MISFRLIQVGELDSFVENDPVFQEDFIPISRQRALSQFHNPLAKPDDPALLLLLNDNRLIGYFGFLPDQIEHQKFYWNSCWYIKPGTNGVLSMKLFYKALSLCKGQMMLTDFTPYTMDLVKKSNQFAFEKNRAGKRYILRFYLAEWLPSKWPYAKVLKPLLQLGDALLNALRFRKSVYVDEMIKAWECLSEIHEDFDDFILQNSQDSLFKRNSVYLNWVMKYPWVWPNDKDVYHEKGKYYFSSFDKSFNYQAFALREKGILKSLILFSNRNGHLFVPFMVFEEAFQTRTFAFIRHQIGMQGAKSFYSYNQKLISYLDQAGLTPLKVIRLKNFLAIGKSIDRSVIPATYQLQDGDGDVIFT